MTSPFSDELISAYLDGELTDREQARVEKQLGEDAGLQRMCDELRALRFTLQAMPTADPSDDLAERVLRQAERRMLLGDDESADKDREVQPPAAIPHIPLDPAATATRRPWRFVASCVATVAALLLVAVMLFDQNAATPNTDEVARGTPRNSSSDVAVESLEEESLWARESEPDGGGLGGSLDNMPSEGLPSEGLPSEGLPSEGLPSEGEEARKEPAVSRSVAEETAESDMVGDAQRSVAIPNVPPPRQEASARSGGAAASAAFGAAEHRRPTASEDSPSSGAGMGGAGGMDGPGKPDRGVSRPQEMDGYGVAGERPGANLADDASAPRGSASPTAGREGRRSYGSAALAKPEPGTTTDESSHGEMYSKSNQSARSSSSTDPKTLGLTGQDTAARVAVAAQLVSKLDTDRSLLVQVSLPRDLANRLYLSTVTPVDRLARLKEASKLLDTEGLSQIEVTAPSARGEVPLESTRRRPLPDIQPLENAEHTWVVEGAPEDVRHALQRLVSRSDVAVHSMPTAASGQQPVDLRMLGTGLQAGQAQSSRSQPTYKPTPESESVFEDGVSDLKEKMPSGKGLAPSTALPSGPGESSVADGSESGLPRYGTQVQGKVSPEDSTDEDPGKPSDGSSSRTQSNRQKEVVDRESNMLDAANKPAVQAGTRPDDEHPNSESIVTPKSDLKKESEGASLQPPASAAGQRRGLDRGKDADTPRRDALSAVDKARQSEKTLQANVPANPSTPALSYSAQARPAQDVVYFLFRFKAATAAASVPQEAAAEPGDKQ